MDQGSTSLPLSYSKRVELSGIKKKNAPDLAISSVSKAIGTSPQKKHVRMSKVAWRERA